MKKIVILENSEADFIKLKSALLKRFGDKQIVVLPFFSDSGVYPEGVKRTYSSFAYINNQIARINPLSTSENGTSYKNSLFDDIVEYYKDADLFLIDRGLLGKEDRIGIDFYEFLDEKGSQIPKLILTARLDATADSEPYSFNYFTKDEEEKIIEYVSKHLDIKTLLGPDKFWNKLWNWFKLCWLGDSKAVNIAITFLLRFLIVLAFCMGLVITCKQGWSYYYATSNENSTLKSDSENKKTDSVLGSPDKQKEGTDIDSINRNHLQRIEHERTMQLLRLVENIFLNFLPFFILLGFLSYYLSYLRGLFQGLDTSKIHTSASTKQLKLSKVLFTSSIIATIIINSIEKSMELDLNGNYKLIAFIPNGVLLLILIGYFYMLEKDEGNEGNEGK